MNTTEVGDNFEREIYDYFVQEVRNGQFYFRPECCKFYRQKGYYSRQRESDIIFDVAIEVFRPGESTYSMLLLIECKKYRHAVPVSDVEEFFTKVQQVGAANTKAIMVSSNAFQEGGIKFARANGIGLMRYQTTDLKWILNRAPSALRSTASASFLNVMESLVNESHRSRLFDVSCCVGTSFTHSLGIFARALVGEACSTMESASFRTSRPARLVRFVSTDTIESRAVATLQQVSYVDGPVPLEKLVQAQAGLQYVQEAPGPDESNVVLGRISFSPPKITVYEHDDELSPRQRFTLAHELGHYFLDHGRYMGGEVRESDDDLDSSAPLPALPDVQRLEWQANYFASCLLLPRAQMVRSFRYAVRHAGISNRGFGPLYVDDQQCNQEAYHVVSGALASVYAVSRSVVRVRLTSLGLLRDASSFKRASLGIAEGRIFRGAGIKAMEWLSLTENSDE